MRTNPLPRSKGRKPGLQNHTTRVQKALNARIFAEQIVPCGEEIVERALKLVREGDVSITKFLLEPGQAPSERSYTSLN